MKVKKVTQDLLDTNQPDDKSYVYISRNVESKVYDIEWYKTGLELDQVYMSNDINDRLIYRGLSVDCMTFVGDIIDVL